MPDGFEQLQALMLRRLGGDREMVDVLALVLHHDEQAAPAAVELALAEGATDQDPRAEHASHRLVDGKTTAGPDIDAPQAPALRREPKADVGRCDALRARTAGGRHAT